MGSTWQEEGVSAIGGCLKGGRDEDIVAALGGEPPTADEDLLARIRKSDEEAMGQFYDRFHASVFQFVLHMTGDGAIAGDVTQDLFVLVLEGAGRRLFSRFDPRKGDLEGYLLGVARKLTRKQIGRQLRWLPIEVDVRYEGGPGEAVDARLGLAKLRAAIDGLPWKYREVIVLCCLQEKSYEQTAAIADCSVGTVASRLSRARQLLWRRLSAKRTT